MRTTLPSNFLFYRSFYMALPFLLLPSIMIGQSCQTVVTVFGIPIPGPIVTVTLLSVSDVGGGTCAYEFSVNISNSINANTSIVTFSPTSGSTGSFSFSQTGNWTQTTTINGPCSGIAGAVTLTGFGNIGPINYTYDGCSFALTSSILPIELSTFSATPQEDGQIALNWTTATELNNEGFEIQRSYDALDWEYVSFISGQGTTSVPSDYVYLDNLPPGVESLYYRLKQMDQDGAYEFSPVINISLDRLAIPILKLYPNPAETTLNITSNAGSMVIFSAIGQPLQRFELQQGTNNLNIAELPAGVYILQVELANGERVSRQFVKQ